MARNISKHLGGTKGSLFTQRLKATPLEKTILVPIEIGKHSLKALVADCFGVI